LFVGGTKTGGGKRPAFSTGNFPIDTDKLDPHELEEAARAKLSLNGWNYAASNAGNSFTDLVNREAFYRQRIIPRMLRDTNRRDTSIELFWESD
jgi:hypothetical protein